MCYGLKTGRENGVRGIGVLELQEFFGSDGVILRLGAKFKYRFRSEFASMIRWVIWSLLRRSVMPHSSFQGRIS